MRHIYGWCLFVAGVICRREELPEHGRLASARARRLATALDRYLERKTDLPRKLYGRLAELAGFFDGLKLYDEGDYGNAGLAWTQSMLVRMGRKPRLIHTPLPADIQVAQLFELLGRQYARLGDWELASECFAGTLLYGGRSRRSTIRAISSQAIACELMAGNAEGARNWFDLMPDRITHRAGQVFRDIVDQLLTTDVELDVDVASKVSQVRSMSAVTYAYLTVVIAERLVAENRSGHALALLLEARGELRAEQADGYLNGSLTQAAAGIYSSMNDHETALRLAVSAWSSIDEQRYLACSHRQRHQIWSRFGHARYVALRASVEMGDARAVAELIESSRLQSLIATEIETNHDEKDGLRSAGETVAAATGENGREQPDDVMVSSAIFAAMNDGLATTLLESYAPVTYRGTSLFPVTNHHSIAGATSVSRALDDALPEGLFWSTHVENGVMFWFLAGDGEPIGCGMTDLSRTENVTPVLLGLAGHSDSAEPETWSLPPYQHQAGDYYEPYLHLAAWMSPEEQIISHTIGALLPDALVDLLRTADAPLEVTIAAAREFGCVPWPIAVVPGTQDRLIEHAVLRMWTSAPTQLSRRSRPQPPAGTPIPFLLACDNPDGTLRERTAISPVSSARTLLGGPDSAVPATKDTLMSTLHEIGPGTPGLFYYRGHAVHDSDPAWSTLPLTEGFVQAGELFGTLDDGTPFLPMPSRVMVTGCSSSGGSLLAGEGLGLAAGLIQAGATQVVSTAIDIMDTSFTEAFEDLLIKGMLAPGTDHAVLLRAAQLRMLREWKIYSLRGGFDHREDIKDPHPIIWTAYHAY
ncbi:CHAT domain-containing protein [Saccharothrix texasensis]|uniref:CHAT domain-containing protein n=1 Tax=Saccharothrix texasensis TaxID=103734 RepID=A0A3N1HGZ9_9PSEU|nr:CHAT domain-containing protein [Saccharothrix texasensis]ROP41767.1 CHAT domain-containing protein [Saccharothrix texasensis]